MLNSAVLTAESVAARHKNVGALSLDRARLDGRLLWRWFLSLNVLGLLFLAVVLRCRDLGNLPGINGDEAWYGVQAELCLRGEPIAWRTPSGNLLNPLFFGPQVAMHSIFAPSFVILRATAVVSGLLALLVNFWLCRRVMGESIATISTIILAVLPIDIAYSRLAWDASQSLLATLPCIYLPLWAIIDARLKVRCSMLALVALALAIVVHPTNLFVSPIVAVGLGYAWREEIRQIAKRICVLCPQQWRQTVMISMSSIVAAGAIGAAAGLRPAWLGPAIARVANPPQYAAFVANFGRLFTGATVYEYLSGEITPPASGKGGFRSDCVPYDLSAWLIGGWLVWRLVHVVRRNRPELICLIVGFGACLFGFFLVAGPGALAPGFERYVIWMIAPTAILSAVALGSWQARPGSAGRRSSIVAIAAGWLLLICFQRNCLGFMHETGGRSHQTFRTAAVEPKQAALAYILTQRAPGETVRIMTSEWWIYWPMRYLSMGPPSRDPKSQLSVELHSVAASSAALRQSTGLPRGKSWFVEFTDSEASDVVRQLACNSGMSLQETTIDDFSGHPLVSIFTVGSASRRPVHDSEKN